MKNYYECHITMLGDPETIKPLVERVGWKFSCINGDPVLGDGVKCYATMLYSKLHGDNWVQMQLLSTAAMLAKSGALILRRKVELVIYDDRDVSAVCDGGCCEANGRADDRDIAIVMRWEKLKLAFGSTAINVGPLGFHVLTMPISVCVSSLDGLAEVLGRSEE